MPDRSDNTRVTAIPDDELARIALAASPFDPFDPEIRPFEAGETGPDALLPEWYMPAPHGRPGRGRVVVFASLAIALLVINVGGFCVTYGFPEFVWS